MKKNEVNGKGNQIAQMFFGKGKRLMRDGSVKDEKQRIIDFAANLKREEAREKEFSYTAQQP